MRCARAREPTDRLPMFNPHEANSAFREGHAADATERLQHSDRLYEAHCARVAEEMLKLSEETGSALLVSTNRGPTLSALGVRPRHIRRHIRSTSDENAQISAANHPISVHPSSRLMRKMGTCLL